VPHEINFVKKVIIVMTTIGHLNSRPTMIQEALDPAPCPPTRSICAGEEAVRDQRLADRRSPRGCNLTIECFSALCRR
jgi:hypothetical protein